MKFTYSSYNDFLKLIKECGYSFQTFLDYKESDKCVVLRHDIDNSLAQALRLAQIEADAGVKSTFFVLLNTDFYNVASNRSKGLIKEIVKLGNDIGLHFDETAYDCDEQELKTFISHEAKVLSDIIEYPVSTFSMHRPNKRVLNSNLIVPGLINAYGHPFFDEFKYLSDSRREWREPVVKIITSGEYNRIQILTHAFWYHEKEEDISATIKNYIYSANSERYSLMKDNIKDLESIMKKFEG